MLPSACGLGRHFQALGHSFSPYGPPSRQITYIYLLGLKNALLFISLCPVNKCCCFHFFCFALITAHKWTNMDNENCVNPVNEKSFIRLVVIKDYECVRRRIVTLIDTLNDFPIWLLTSVYCKINIFPSTTGVYIKIFQWQSPCHSDRIEQVPVQTALRDGANFRKRVSWKD